MNEQRLFYVMIAKPEELVEVNEFYERDMKVRGNQALLQSGPPVLLTKEEEEELRHAGFTRCFIARDGASGALIGHASLHTVLIPHRGRTGRVENVITDKLFEGRGVGRGVMSSLMRYAEAHAFRRLDLVSELHRIAARSMYLSMGFHQEADINFTCHKIDPARLALEVTAPAGSPSGSYYVYKQKLS